MAEKVKTMSKTYKKSFKTIMPYSITWFLTKNCNLTCSHCYFYSKDELPKSKDEEIKFNEAKEIVDQLVSQDVFLIVFCGGEVLTIKWFPKLIDYCNQVEIKTIFSSNGALLSKKLAQQFKKARISGIQLSLDGAKADTHDLVRGKGNFKQVLSAASLCEQEGIPVQFAYTLTSVNYFEINELLNLCFDKKAVSLKLNLFIPFGRSINDKYLICNKEELRKTIDKCRDFESKTENNLTISYPCFIIKDDESCKTIWDPNIKPSSLMCGAGSKRGIIYEDGSVGTCEFFPNERIGNLKYDDFSTIWNSGLDKIEKWRRLDLMNGKCESCGYKSDCGFGCRAYAYYVGGDFYGWDPSCLLFD